jgi:hypothetical protein
MPLALALLSNGSSLPAPGALSHPSGNLKQRQLNQHPMMPVEISESVHGA